MGQAPTLSPERLQDLTNRFSNLANWLQAQNIPDMRKFKRMKPEEINFARLKLDGQFALKQLRLARQSQDRPEHYEYHLLLAIEWLKDGGVEVERAALQEWLKTACLE